MALFMTMETLQQLLESVIAEKNITLLKDRDVRTFLSTQNKAPRDVVVSSLTNIINKHASEMRDVSSHFANIVQKSLPKKDSPKRYKFVYELKSVGSIINKVVDRKRDLGDLGDIVRGAVLFNSPTDLEVFVKDFKRKYSHLITQYEFKQKGSDPTFGYYGSHHFDLLIDGYNVEFQVMLQKLWKTKEGGAHQIYAKNRTNPQGADKFDTNLSKRLFAMANRPVREDESESDLVIELRIALDY